jgi:hypothetical protein
MSRRADPARIYEARRAATVMRLEMSGMSSGHLSVMVTLDIYS